MATLTEPLPRTDAAIEAALAEAHLPTLMMALVHLTGDASVLIRRHEAGLRLLRRRPPGRLRRGSRRASAIAAPRGASRRIWPAHKLPPPPAPATVRRMMDFIAGAEIPEHYVPFLMEELAIDGVDPKRPALGGAEAEGRGGEDEGGDRSAPACRACWPASGCSRPAFAFTIVEKNADVGGTWFENTYPGCRVDNPNHLYSYSFEPNHDWP